MTDRRKLLERDKGGLLGFGIFSGRGQSQSVKGYNGDIDQIRQAWLTRHNISGEPPSKSLAGMALRMAEEWAESMTKRTYIPDGMTDVRREVFKHNYIEGLQVAARWMESMR